MFLAFLFFAGGWIFSKMERTFFFLGFCPPSIRAVWRGFNADSGLRKLFSGDFDFRKTETNLFLNFARPQKGVWGMNAGGLLEFFWRSILKISFRKYLFSYSKYFVIIQI